MSVTPWSAGERTRTADSLYLTHEPLRSPLCIRALGDSIDLAITVAQKVLV